MVPHTLVAAAQSASTPAGARGVFALAVGGLSAWRGYVRAKRVVDLTGRRPWNWSPMVWSVVCFFSLFLGRLCLWAASDRALRQGVRPASAPNPAAVPAPMFAAAPPPAPVAAMAATTPMAAGPAAPRAMTILPGG